MKQETIDSISLPVLEQAVEVKRQINSLEGKLREVLFGQTSTKASNATSTTASGQVDRRKLPKSAAVRARMSAGIAKAWRRRRREQKLATA